MFDGLFIASLIGSCVKGIKESFVPTITAEQWGNKELIHQDIMNGVSAEQRIKNAQNGKYIVREKYSEPHRNERGQIMIENSQLYNQDLFKYGAVQTMKWVKQGKYNLAPKELERENERLKEEFKRLYGLSK